MRPRLGRRDCLGDGRIASPQLSVVERLIILNAPHPIAFLKRMTLRQLRKSWYMLLFQLPRLGEHLLRRNDFRGLRETLRWGAHVPGTFTNEELDCFVEAMARPGALTAAIHYYRAIRHTNPLTLTKRIS